jgi:hypothetical protein
VEIIDGEAVEVDVDGTVAVVEHDEGCENPPLPAGIKFILK